MRMAIQGSLTCVARVAGDNYFIPPSNSKGRIHSLAVSSLWVRVAGPPVQHGQGHHEKRPESGMLAGFLLR